MKREEIIEKVKEYKDGEFLLDLKSGKEEDQGPYIRCWFEVVSDEGVVIREAHTKKEWKSVADRYSITQEKKYSSIGEGIAEFKVKGLPLEECIETVLPVMYCG